MPGPLVFRKKKLYKVIMTMPPPNLAPAPAPTKDPAVRARTRRAVLDLLKRDGPLDAKTLGAALGVSAMAVRQHLYDLASQKLVAFEEEPRAMGRPAKLWRLTPGADRFFPDGHAELTASLLATMTAAFGAKGLGKMLALRGKEMARAYGKRIGTKAPLRKRLDTLARIRAEEGYMAEVRDDPDGGFLLLEHHCPICVAATACSGLCEVEIDVFRRVLGAGVTVERTDHILAGATRCAYRITAAKS